MSFGSRLTIIRKEHKISQSELAQKAGIHSNVLGRHEREEATPPVEMAVKIADVLGVSFDYLVGKTDVELDQAILEKSSDHSKAARGR
jgi:transcriptional regulator with XRE-family HTH domain